MSASVAVVLAPPLDRYPPLPMRGEAYLAQPVRVEPCACGGRLWQRPGQSDMAVVGDHQRTDEHRAWRERMEAS